MGRKAQIAIIVAVLLLVGERSAPTPTTTRARTRSPTASRSAASTSAGSTGPRRRRSCIAAWSSRCASRCRSASTGKTYTLPGAKLKIHANINGMVDQALAASRDGGLPGRLVRYVTGGSVDKQIEPEVTYSQPAINRFVRTVASKIDRDPQDASVSPDRLLAQRGPRPGRPQGARRRPHRAAQPRRDGRHGLAHDQGVVHSTKPKVSTGEVAARVPDLPHPRSRQLHPALLEEPEADQVLHGRRRPAGLETPAGLYHIQDKQVTRPGTCPTRPGPATSRGR